LAVLESAWSTTCRASSGAEFLRSLERELGSCRARFDEFLELIRDLSRDWFTVKRTHDRFRHAEEIHQLEDTGAPGVEM